MVFSMEDNFLAIVSGIVSIISFLIFILAREEKSQTTALFIFICFAVLFSMKAEKSNIVFGKESKSPYGVTK